MISMSSKCFKPLKTWQILSLSHNPRWQLWCSQKIMSQNNLKVIFKNFYFHRTQTINQAAGITQSANMRWQLDCKIHTLETHPIQRRKKVSIQQCNTQQQQQQQTTHNTFIQGQRHRNTWSVHALSIWAEFGQTV